MFTLNIFSPCFSVHMVFKLIYCFRVHNHMARHVHIYVFLYYKAVRIAYKLIFIFRHKIFIFYWTNHINKIYNVNKSNSAIRSMPGGLHYSEHAFVGWRHMCILCIVYMHTRYVIRAYNSERVVIFPYKLVISGGSVVVDVWRT